MVLKKLRIVKQSSFLDSWFHFQSFCLKLDFKLPVLNINLCTHQTGLSSFSLIRRHTEAYQCLSYPLICWVEVSFAYSEQFYSLEIRENWNVMFFTSHREAYALLNFCLGYSSCYLCLQMLKWRDKHRKYIRSSVFHSSVRNVKQIQLT